MSKPQVWPEDLDPRHLDPRDPDPWTVLNADAALWIDPEAKQALVRNMRSGSRRLLLPLVRPLAGLAIILLTVLRKLLPWRWSATRLLHRIIICGLKAFVRQDANLLVLRHFHLGTEILAFIAANVPGFRPNTRPLRPARVEELAPDVFLQHDLNIYLFIGQLNAYLVETGRALEPPARLDFSAITDGPLPLDAGGDGRLKVVDLQSAIEALTPLYQLLLSDRDFWRAANSLQLDETIGVYVARLLGDPMNLAFLNNRHPLVPLSTLRAGFRLMLHGLATEQLHGYLRQRKRALQAAAVA